jgi:hypothetical protein
MVTAAVSNLDFNYPSGRLPNFNEGRILQHNMTGMAWHGISHILRKYV